MAGDAPHRVIRMPAAGNVLVVCTGNICRSPLIERLLRAGLGDTGIGVCSAGTGALVGHPMDPDAAARLTAMGGSAEGFAARQLTPEIALDADLVLTATRAHRGQVVQLQPRALRYTFALADFHDLAAEMPPGTGSSPLATDDDTLVTRIVDGAASRRGRLHPRRGEDADIVDPYRQSAAVFDQMARQVTALLPPVIATMRAWAAAEH